MQIMKKHNALTLEAKKL